MRRLPFQGRLWTKKGAFLSFELFPLSADLPGIGAAVRLPGRVEYIGKEDGKPYYESEVPEVLLVMNAMDGTVIG